MAKNKKIIPNILYIDDEINNLEAFKANFRRDYNIFLAKNTQEAREILSQNLIDIILTDQRMPDETGVEFLENIKDKYSDIVRILVTGYSDIDAVIDAVNKGQIYKYIQKPWDRNFMKKLLDKTFEVYQLEKEKNDLRDKILTANKQLEFMLRQKLNSLGDIDNNES